MEIRKVKSEDKVRVLTYYPEYFIGLLDFPGIVFEGWDPDITRKKYDERVEFFIQCPSTKTASELSGFLRAYSDSTMAGTLG